jgi:hypothetical protein
MSSSRHFACREKSGGDFHCSLYSFDPDRKRSEGMFKGGRKRRKKKNLGIGNIRKECRQAPHMVIMLMGKHYLLNAPGLDTQATHVGKE